MTFRDIKFHETLQYRSDGEHIPLEFYESTFPVAKEIDLLLGYFSSNAFKVLSRSMAEFIYNGGSMRIITNHIFSQKDKENLLINNKLDSEDEIIDIFGDIEQLEKELSEEGKHFFDCLKYLISKDRLKLVPVLFNEVNLVHCKTMILHDGNDYITTDGSINFTLSALMKNSESLTVNVPWIGTTFEQRNIEIIDNFNLIFNKEHPAYKYLEPKEVEGAINKIGNSKEIEELLEDSMKLDDSYFSNKIKNILDLKKVRFEEKIRELKTVSKDPRFPFPEGPREYQEIAYNNWINKDYCGLFAMATGTGKTITSLNCVLEESKKNNGHYKFIVLVPTRALVDQWEKEILKQFNFQKLISIKSKYFYDELKYEDEQESSCILVTYATFKSNKFQTVFSRVESKQNYTLIADEAHNMGSPGFLNVMTSLNPIQRRIGLSATPSRYFDEDGEKIVYDFFKIGIIEDKPDFTFSLSIFEAINYMPSPFLCPYEYKIKFVSLENDELERYKSYTRQLMNYIDQNGVLKKCVEVENILKLRKDVIKKAKNKKQKLIEIIQEIGLDKFKFAFVYVPEGNEIDYSEIDSDWNEANTEEKKIISEYTHSINAHFNNSISIGHFTGETKERNLTLNQFSTGQLKALFAMKCLDEGVDVPRTEIAIFCSSTGNPRQYIQRRGRVLRLHENKKKATIYDMIVIPLLSELNDSSKEYNCEKKLVESELRRLIDFAKDSLSLDEVLLNKGLIEVCDFFNIDMSKFINF